MDRTGRVNGTYKLLQNALQGDAIRAEPPPLPQRGPYRVIVADPPWQYDVRQEDPSQRVCPYPCLSDAKICALDVSSIAHADCILWLWTTNPRIPSAFKVLDAWGFEHKTMLTWATYLFRHGKLAAMSNRALLVGGARQSHGYAIKSDDAISCSRTRAQP